MKSQNFWLIRIFLLIPQFYLKSSYSFTFCLIVNSVYIEQWLIQNLLFLFSLKEYKDIYLLLLCSLIQRNIEIQKRKLFVTIYQKELQKRNQIFLLNSIPQKIIKIDQNFHMTLNNTQQIQEFNKEAKQLLMDQIKKKRNANLILDGVEYYFKLLKPNQYLLVQLLFSSGICELFEYLDKQIDSLYNQLCQDYYKWNNLRAGKVVQESDLAILAQCTTECRLLKHQMGTMIILSQDLGLINQKPREIKFYMKNYVINLVESTINDLQDQYELINLTFEQGIPDVIIADKDIMLYCLYSFLLTSCQKQNKIKEGKLNINARIARVNDDKSGYDLEFCISCPFNPKQLRLYTNQDYNNTEEQLLQYIINKCKNGQEIELKSDTENLNIIYTAKFMFNSQNDDKLIDNISITDLNFTKNIVEKDHYIWKKKPNNDSSTPRNKQLKQLNTFSDYTSQQNQKDQILSQINSQQQSIQNSQNASPKNQLSTQDTIKQYEILFPEIKELIVGGFEDVLLQAYEQGLVDHEIIQIDLNIDEKMSQVYAESVHGPNDSEIISVRQLEFTTPQVKPRSLLDREKEKRFVKITKIQKKIDEYDKKKKQKEKQLNLLFSPSVMSKFSNNLVKFSQLLQKRSAKLIHENHPIQNLNFNEQILLNRKNQKQKKWTHKLNVINEPPQICQQILCLISSTMYQSAANRFSNCTYGEQKVDKHILVYSTFELIQKYKEYFLQKKQFFFILLYLDNIIGIFELSQAIQINENQWLKHPNFKPTNLIGIHHGNTINKSVYQYMKLVFTLNQDEEQLQKSKERIASLYI